MLVILVSEKASKKDVMALAEWLCQKNEGRLDALDVFDSEALWNNIDGPPTVQPFPREEWDRHWLAGMDASSVGKAVWLAKDRADNPVEAEAKRLAEARAKEEAAAKRRAEKEAADKAWWEQELARRDEAAAAGKLVFARSLLKDGKKTTAREYCEEIIKKYPKTKAAVEAKALLETIKKN